MQKKKDIRVLYNRIKVELTEAGKKNTDLASYLQVHHTTVSDWCTNTNQPSIQDLYRIAEFLRIDPRKLLKERNWEVDATTPTEEPTTPAKKKKKK